ncbi:MAG: ATP-binding cassette domain-containing protein [Bacteroidales bacterium]|nr:ATP-binding cassette domain-containing protein [Bacteroidales bacterium]
MSEQIIKALMQLFAIIARPESNTRDRREVVESFLKRQLNLELVKEYLKVFDYYYNLYQEKQKGPEKKKTFISSSSVRVLKIVTDINEELTLQQKVIVIFQLLEFAKSEGNEVTGQEIEFIDTVAETLYLDLKAYAFIKQYVLSTIDAMPDINNILVINNNQETKKENTKHIYSENLDGEIAVYHVDFANMYLLRYLGAKEIYLNGQLLQEDKIVVFNTGSSIRNPQIKPIYYGDVVSEFIEDKFKSKIVFEVKDLEFKFKSGKIGLHQINFSEESGRLVGIMGASGAGKSTLLNTLNGVAEPSKGEILINGVNIHKESEKIEGVIGFVSQDDLLIEELTVYQNLYYNAKLCFSNYSETQLVEAVNKVLMNLGLYEIRDIQVGSPLNKKISGGQRKRLNIALELIREPAVLFLDEPTSGLSSRDSENIMDLLKELTLKGKLVFVVIHQPSSELFKMFDRLIILDTGGYLIYNGDPIDSIIYFKSRIQHANWNESECHCCGNVNPEQIFNIVEQNVLDEYGKITPLRKISPKEWNEHYQEYATKNTKEIEKVTEIPEVTFKIPGKLKQLFVFVKRDVLSKLANTQYLIINFLEAPLLAFLLSYIIKFYNVSETNEFGYTFSNNSNIPVYIFMAVIVAIFMGLTVSAEEIIKDRKILKREAFLNLSWSSYLFSKIVIQLGLSAIQAFTFVIIGNTILELKGMFFQYWLVLFSAWASANIMGLVISDSFKTVVTIYILIPFLVIPQIILSGVLVKYDKLNPQISAPSHIPIYGEIITARWAYEGLAVYQFTQNKYNKDLYEYDKKMSIANFKKNYWYTNLKNKIDYIERHAGQEEYKDQVVSDITLLRNEISKELNRNDAVSFKYVKNLKYGHITPDLIKVTKKYIDEVKDFYVKMFNDANAAKDKIISSRQATPQLKEEFLQLKREYYNENLAEFCENKNEVDRIIEYKGNLFQKIDPIYLDPEFPFIKSHFYAPRKMVFGKYYSTFWVNTIVIWATSLFLFIILYFRLLKRLLDFFEQLSYRFGKNKG